MNEPIWCTIDTFMKRLSIFRFRTSIQKNTFQRSIQYELIDKINSPGHTIYNIRSKWADRNNIFSGKYFGKHKNYFLFKTRTVNFKKKFIQSMIHIRDIPILSNKRKKRINWYVFKLYKKFDIFVAVSKMEK